jgi:hypothetical protein
LTARPAEIPALAPLSTGLTPCFDSLEHGGYIRASFTGPGSKSE